MTEISSLPIALASKPGTRQVRAKRAQAVLLVLALFCYLFTVTLVCKGRVLPYNDDGIVRWPERLLMASSSDLRFIALLSFGALVAGVATAGRSLMWRAWRFLTFTLFALTGIYQVACATFFNRLKFMPGFSDWRIISDQAVLAKFYTGTRSHEWLALVFISIVLAVSTPFLLRRVSVLRFSARRAGMFFGLALLALAAGSHCAALFMEERYENLRPWYTELIAGAIDRLLFS